MVVEGELAELPLRIAPEGPREWIFLCASGYTDMSITLTGMVLALPTYLPAPQVNHPKQVTGPPTWYNTHTHTVTAGSPYLVPDVGVHQHHCREVRVVK